MDFVFLAGAITVGMIGADLFNFVFQYSLSMYAAKRMRKLQEEYLKKLGSFSATSGRRSEADFFVPTDDLPDNKVN